MIPPRAIHLLIKHFDCVDQAVSQMMMRKKPWQETALTSWLCDLLDEETQRGTRLEYSLDDLNRDMRSGDALPEVVLQVETHEYDAIVERWVTQADLGLVMNFRNFLVPEASCSVAYLLQAKRLSANRRQRQEYTEASRFQAFDTSQHERMVRLCEIVEGARSEERREPLLSHPHQFIQHLLYCPRPSSLDEATRVKLAFLRNRALSANIFDYIYGLELYNDLGAEHSTLAAGIFVADLRDAPRTLAAVHDAIMVKSTPLSWFLTTQILRMSDNGRPGRSSRPDSMPWLPLLPLDPDAPAPDFDPRAGLDGWAHALVRGDTVAIEVLEHFLPELEEREFAFFPPHTITIDITIGHNLDPKQRRIRVE